jgi:hypothetical protein
MYTRACLCFLICLANCLGSWGFVPGVTSGGSKTIAAQCGVHCGTERWAVKTLTDDDSSSVNTTPEEQTVHQLVSQPRPRGTLPPNNRTPLELKTFKVTAQLVGYKTETDQDFHVVIADLDHPTETMIVEIPSKDCSGACASGHTDDFDKARQVIIDLIGEFTGTGLLRPQELTAVEVTGVGFFDFCHGQTGVARNVIELHPVLNIKKVDSSAMNLRRVTVRSACQTASQARRRRRRA